ncbi:MAG: alpha/beta hydrolase [Actinobacteria bacterium]|nr:alpha/beta hydrolase [Actinomycetota bacterium]
MGRSIYKSLEYKGRFYELYDRFVDLLPFAVEEGYVQTSFGITHYLSTGPQGLPLLFHFHGGNSLNPHALLSIARLAGKFRIISPDIVGQPGKSAETRINPKTLDYGRWATEVIEYFGQDKVLCMGVSFGGGVLMHMAVVSPGLLAKVALLVPTALVRIDTRDSLLKFGPALIRYALHKSDENLLRIVKPLIPDISLISEPELELFKAIFNGLRLATGMPRPVARDELVGFTAPCMIAAAENDILCPARRVFASAAAKIPNLARTLLFENRPHMVTSYEDSMKVFCEEAEAFLAD